MALHLAATGGAVLWWLDRTLREGAGSASRASLLIALGGLASIGRPEGVFAALVVTAAVVSRPPEERRRTMRAVSLLALAPWFIPSLVALVTTGSASTSGTAIKLMPADPYRTWEQTRRVFEWNAQNIFARLFVGATIPPILTYRALPRATYALVGLGLVGLYRTWTKRAGNDGRLAFLAWFVSMSVMIAPLLYTWIGNMGRYVLAFAPMLVLTAALGLTALADELFGRFRRAPRLLASVLPLGVAGLFMVEPSAAVREHAEAAREICAQQVAMAERIRSLPPEAVVAVNDAGAITYLGEHLTWDLIGLTSPEAALPRLSGVGSIFERLERLPAERRPTHAAIYPAWFPGFSLLGPELARETVQGPYVGG
ncbi:MAG: hypothetical protein H5U40_17965, partial [Polyangiaceae bacterium]|nr:hypothetical protein [Polyangiaceae bacterium]